MTVVATDKSGRKWVLKITVVDKDGTKEYVIRLPKAVGSRWETFGYVKATYDDAKDRLILEPLA